MNTTLLQALQGFIGENGKSVLADSRRVAGHLADYAAKEPKAQRNAFIRCLEHGFYTQLQNAPESERTMLKTNLARRLHDDEGFDMALCTDSVDLLAAAMFGEAAVSAASTTPVPEASVNGNEWVSVGEAKGEEVKAEDAAATPTPVPAAPPSATPQQQTAVPPSAEYSPPAKLLMAAAAVVVVVLLVAGVLIVTQSPPSLDKGKEFVEKHNYDAAIAEFSKVIILNPNNAEAYFERGKAHYKYSMVNGRVLLDDHYYKAIADLTEAVRLNPNGGIGREARELLRKLK